MTAPPAPPAGYRVVQWADVAPDALVDGIAYLLHRMVLDAPMGDMGPVIAPPTV